MKRKDNIRIEVYKKQYGKRYKGMERKVVVIRHERISEYRMLCDEETHV